MSRRTLIIGNMNILLVREMIKKPVINKIFIIKKVFLYRVARNHKIQVFYATVLNLTIVWVPFVVYLFPINFFTVQTEIIKLRRLEGTKRK